MPRRLIAICGASGTGKTTLAKAAATRLGASYHDVSFGRLAAALGWNSVADLAAEDRMAMQRAVLHSYTAELASLDGTVILDRSPLDMIAYQLGEVTMHNTETRHGRDLMDYVEACIRETERWIDGICIVQPLPEYEASSHRPTDFRPYQLQIQLIIEGVHRRVERSIRSVLIEETDLAVRLDRLCSLVVDVEARGRGRANVAAP